LAPSHDTRFPDDVTMCTSHTPGVPRLGGPALLMSDSSMGIVNMDVRPGDTATALPASIVLASGFNPELARAGGRMIGREARSRGFNLQLAGGVNLARDPRNGRNFEYLGEDPLFGT
jgi:beta-glucosidase